MDHLIFDMVYERFNISFYLLKNKLLMSFILCISSNFLLILSSLKYPIQGLAGKNMEILNI